MNFLSKTLIKINPIEGHTELLLENNSSEYQQDNLITQIIQSTKLDIAALRLKSVNLLLIGLVLTVSSLFVFNLVSSTFNDVAIQNNYNGKIDDLLILDLRNGYSVSAVNRVLSDWSITLFANRTHRFSFLSRWLSSIICCFRQLSSSMDF
jgi:hypothetical protein